MPFSLLLFDLDGTLSNTDPLHFAAWRECLLPHGIAIDENIYKARITGHLNPAIVRDFLPDMPEDKIWQFIDDKEARFRELAHKMQPTLGLHELIDWAKANGKRVGLVTNAPRSNTEFTLNALGLTGAFEIMVLGEELPLGKPDPLPYRVALERFGARAQDALAFEDSPLGVKSSAGAGIFTVGIASTQPHQALKDVGAAIVVDDFARPELWELLGEESHKG